MKLILTLLLTGATYFIAYCQKEIPAYGKIDIADLKMDKCEFEPEAPALKLVDYGDVVFEFNTSVEYPTYASSSGGGKFTVKMSRRTRIKIFTKEGLSYANVKLPYYSKNDEEKITDLSAKTYNLDQSGKVIESNLEKSTVFNKKINDRMSELIFTMPEVREGSIIEYKYNVYLESVSNLKDWYFQDFIPTSLSAYRVLIPEYFVFMTGNYTTLPMEDVRKLEDHTMSTKEGQFRYAADRRFLKMKNIPSLKEEPHMSSYRDYLQRIEFQLSKVVFGLGNDQNLMSTWPMLANQLLEDKDFGQQIKKEFPAKAEVRALLSNVSDPHKKVAIIYDYVRRNLNWNGSNGIYCLDGIKSVWDRKSGSSSDINFVLLSLLKSEGIKAFPILVSTRDNGVVNEASPFLYQFNKVMVYVEVGDIPYVLNAAEKYCPLYLVPDEVMNTKGFIVDLMDGGFVTLFISKAITNTVVVNGSISEDGKMRGEAKVYSYDYARIPRTRLLNENKKNFEKLFTKNFSGLVVDSLIVKNQEADSLALEQIVHFNMPLNSSGNYKYFTLNLFSGLDKNPFIAKDRRTDIDFGINQSYTIHGNYMLHEDYSLVEKPKDLMMLSPDSSIVFQRLSQVIPGGLQTRITFNVKKPFYPSTDYADIKEFYQRLFEILDEQIVIQKK